MDLDEQHSPATGLDTGKGFTTSATLATASARPCHTSSLLGLLKSQWSMIAGCSMVVAVVLYTFVPPERSMCVPAG
eukprot:365693-Chlamydomonas_euryale.AAC.15